MKLNKNTYRALGLQIFSLFLAIVVWFYIHGIVKNTGDDPLLYKDLKNIDIKIMGEPFSLGKNFFTVELEHSTVDIRIRGQNKYIAKITPMDIVAYVDVSKLRPGRVYSPVVNLILPQHLELVGVAPIIRIEIKDKNL